MRIPWLRAERFTLHIEPDALRGMIAQGNKPQRWTTVPLPEGTLRNGTVARSKDFTTALKELRETLDAHTQEVHLSFRHRRAILRLLQLPDVPDKMLAETVQREARREFPLSPQELYLSWRKIDGPQTGQKGVFTVGIPRTAVDAYVAALRKAGLKPISFDLKALALARAIHHRHVLLVDMEPTGNRLILLHDFVPCIVRALNLSDRASQSEEATQLMSEAQRVIDYCRNNLGIDDPDEARLCLVGTRPNLDELAEILGRRWEIVAPDPPVSLPAEFPLNTYLANLGLMLKEA